MDFVPQKLPDFLQKSAEAKLLYYAYLSNLMSPNFCIRIGKYIDKNFFFWLNQSSIMPKRSFKLQMLLFIFSVFAARKHYRQVHTDKPFTCFICKDLFKDETSIHLHLVILGNFLWGLFNASSLIDYFYLLSVTAWTESQWQPLSTCLTRKSFELPISDIFETIFVVSAMGVSCVETKLNRLAFFEETL